MDTPVLVAGAGPTGLTLAIELARRGVGVRVVDKAETYFAGSRGDGLQPRTLEVFEDLGVLDAVLAAGSPEYVTKIHVGGRIVGERRMREHVEPTPAVPYPNAWFLGQSRTEGILRDRLADLGVRVELGTELVGLDQDADSVTATLARGEERETVRVAYLVGADGGRSFVRKSLGIAFEGTTDESIRVLLGDVRADGLDHAYSHWFGEPSDPAAGIVLVPLAGTPHFQFGAPLGDGDAEASLPTLQAKLDGFGGADVRLHDLAWSTVWRPNVRLAERFRQGRVFLAGDAAHAHPPTGGQGLNTGIQDGYNLGWKLADGSPELLDSYEAERRAVAVRVIEVSTELMRKYVEGDETAHERGEETQQLDVGYRGGPLAPAADGGVRPGDRAPDSPLVDANGKQVRLFELFSGPHATLLIFGDIDDDIAEDADAVVEPSEGTHVHRILPAGAEATGEDFVDAGGHAYAAYEAAEGTRVLVRPDGYLRAISPA
ncbi:FAD-dependent monooxygenase [Amycolatopsis sp. H20-H5]|uniref:FAD-dependent monooxygenase n=1 Tax=Amycolatopsis sp. H20-H5 TaxID=3046309 RepID=UPI002DBE117F|nr:FAD-dependent monooxygenase [Amycolatopsis sp. H20-H5]MEC3979745.1 FAD-dependent monooxygenase [Amycolatopsis sp. H20-H5]